MGHVFGEILPWEHQEYLRIRIVNWKNKCSNIKPYRNHASLQEAQRIQVLAVYAGIHLVRVVQLLLEFCQFPLRKRYSGGVSDWQLLQGEMGQAENFWVRAFSASHTLITESSSIIPCSCKSSCVKAYYLDLIWGSGWNLLLCHQPHGSLFFPGLYYNNKILLYSQQYRNDSLWAKVLFLLFCAKKRQWKRSRGDQAQQVYHPILSNVTFSHLKKLSYLPFLEP